MDLAGVLERGGLQGQQARRVHLDRHVGQLPLNRLIAADRSAESAPLAGVFQRLFQRRAADSDRLRGDSNPSAVQRLHRHLEALALPVNRQSSGTRISEKLSCALWAP